VRSLRGTQFRRWAIERLNEYLVKDFTMDDERLKAGVNIGWPRKPSRKCSPMMLN